MWPAASSPSGAGQDLGYQPFRRWAVASERTMRNLPLGSGGIVVDHAHLRLEAVQHRPQRCSDGAGQAASNADARHHQHLDPLDRALDDLVALHARQVLDGAGQVVGR